MRRTLALAVFALAGCTPGAPPAGGGGTAAATVIDVSLTSSAVVATSFGSSSGYVPAVTAVALGTTLQFVNRDGFAHTASAVSGTTFPDVPAFGASALTAFGGRLSAGWSTGTLAPGAASPPLLADASGTYLYGCFYHYGAPMRAAIVVR